MPGAGGTVGEISARNARIAELRAEGHTWRAIAARIDLDERSARRAYSDFIANLGENTPLGREAVFDVLERLDETVARATTLYERYESTNANAAIGALRTILRAQTNKIALLSLAGASEMDAARWRADREQFRQFVEAGINALWSVHEGAMSTQDALAKFEAALGLLEATDQA